MSSTAPQSGGRIRVPVRVGRGGTGCRTDRAHCELGSLRTSTGRISSSGGASRSSSAGGAQPDRSRLAGFRRKSSARCDLLTKRTCGAVCGSPPNWRASCSISSAGSCGRPVQRAGARAIALRRSGLRSFSDLDFLISPADFERAKQALAEIGYLPSANFAPAVERLWLRTGYERSFDGAAGKNLVELQWALLPRFYAVDFTRSICAWRICWRAPAAPSSAGAKCRACLPKIRCWCCACTPPSIFGRG